MFNRMRKLFFASNRSIYALHNHLQIVVKYLEINFFIIFLRKKYKKSRKVSNFNPIFKMSTAIKVNCHSH